MDPVYSVHEIAAIFGLTPGGIRYYEDEGLVHPERDYNGFRKYSFDNILELFTLKNYCNFGFKVNEIDKYFSETRQESMENMLALLEKRRDEAEKLAKYYQKTIKHAKWYRKRLSRLEESMRRFMDFATSDHLILMGEPLLGKSTRQKEVLRRWIDAAPLTRLMSFYRFNDQKLVETWPGFLVPIPLAEELKLPTEGTRIFRGVPSLLRVIKLPRAYPSRLPEKMLTNMITEVEATGRRFAGMAISNILFTHADKGVHYDYYDLWMLVDTDQPLIIEKTEC